VNHYCWDKVKVELYVGLWLPNCNDERIVLGIRWLQALLFRREKSLALAFEGLDTREQTMEEEGNGAYPICACM
jgi:hypothetical protein